MAYNASAVGQVIYTRINGTVPCYPNIAPQNTATPYCVYQILSSEADDVKESTSWVDTVVVLLTIYEDTQNTAATHANSIRSALDGYSGTVNTSIKVDSICYLTEATDYDPESLKHIITQEYKIRILNT
jgi:hypothetical protein